MTYRRLSLWIGEANESALTDYCTALEFSHLKLLPLPRLEPDAQPNIQYYSIPCLCSSTATTGKLRKFHSPAHLAAGRAVPRTCNLQLALQLTLDNFLHPSSHLVLSYHLPYHPALYRIATSRLPSPRFAVPQFTITVPPSATASRANPPTILHHYSTACLRLQQSNTSWVILSSGCLGLCLSPRTALRFPLPGTHQIA